MFHTDSVVELYDEWMCDFSRIDQSHRLIKISILKCRTVDKIDTIVKKLTGSKDYTLVDKREKHVNKKLGDINDYFKQKHYGSFCRIQGQD